MSFTFDYYEKMLKTALGKGYRFVGFDTFDPNSTNPSILLRHDIDISIDAAHRLAEIEYRLGIKSTYFWRLNCTFYSVLSQHDYPKIRQIHDEWGHHCGLHFDPLFYENNNLELYEGIARDKKILEAITGNEIKALSQHRPATLGMTEPTAEQAELMRYFTYNPEFTEQAKYISDSCKNWREGDLLQHLDKHRHIQMLIHPVWWNEQDIDWQSCLRQAEEKAVSTIRNKMDIFVERNVGYLERRKRENI